MNSDEMSIIIPCPKPKIDPKVQLEIERLQKYSFVELEAVQQFHAWLDDKRSCRQACRVIGDSRTGKTLSQEKSHPLTIDCSIQIGGSGNKATDEDAASGGFASTNSALCGLLSGGANPSSRVAASR